MNPSTTQTDEQLCIIENFAEYNRLARKIDDGDIDTHEEFEDVRRDELAAKNEFFQHVLEETFFPAVFAYTGLTEEELTLLYNNSPEREGVSVIGDTTPAGLDATLRELHTLQEKGLIQTKLLECMLDEKGETP